MSVAEFAKYVVDNMHRASLANALNIGKKLCNLPIQFNIALRQVSKDNTIPIRPENTQEYDFSEFLSAIEQCVSDYLTSSRINRLLACKILTVVDKYRKLHEKSYKGTEVYMQYGMAYADAEHTKEITPTEGARYFYNPKNATDKEKGVYEYRDGQYVPISLISYQSFMIVDNFIIDLWGCYQNGN